MSACLRSRQDAREPGHGSITPSTRRQDLGFSSFRNPARCCFSGRHVRASHDAYSRRRRISGASPWIMTYRRDMRCQMLHGTPQSQSSALPRSRGLCERSAFDSRMPTPARPRPIVLAALPRPALAMPSASCVSPAMRSMACAMLRDRPAAPAARCVRVQRPAEPLRRSSTPRAHRRRKPRGSIPAGCRQAGIHHEVGRLIEPMDRAVVDATGKAYPPPAMPSSVHRASSLLRSGPTR